MYLLGSLLGYFLMLSIFMTIAIITAKHWFSWLFYAAGAVLQLLSLLGYQKSINNNVFILNENYVRTQLTLRWIIFVVILLVVAIKLIKTQQQHKFVKAWKEAQEITASVNKEKTWQCRCGRQNYDNTLTCFCGTKKRDMQIISGVEAQMVCRYCGKAIDGDSIFCRYCGKSTIVSADEVTPAGSADHGSQPSDS